MVCMQFLGHLQHAAGRNRASGGYANAQQFKSDTTVTLQKRPNPAPMLLAYYQSSSFSLR